MRSRCVTIQMINITNYYENEKRPVYISLLSVRLELAAGKEKLST